LPSGRPGWLETCRQKNFGGKKISAQKPGWQGSQKLQRNNRAAKVAKNFRAKNQPAKVAKDFSAKNRAAKAAQCQGRKRWWFAFSNCITNHHAPSKWTDFPNETR